MADVTLFKCQTSEQGSSVSQCEVVISFCCGPISHLWPVSHTSLMVGVAGTTPMTPPDVLGVWPCSRVSCELCCVVGVSGISATRKLGAPSMGKAHPHSRRPAGGLGRRTWGREIIPSLRPVGPRHARRNPGGSAA